MKIMKKTLAVILLIATVIGCSACTAQNLNAPEYYDNHIYYWDIPTSLKSNCECSEVPEDLKNLAEGICCKVSEFYGIDKKMPKIALVEDNVLRVLLGASPDTPVYGAYIPGDKVIYLPKSFTEKQSVTLAHEYLHYLSDNGSKRGLIYYKYNKGFGKYLSEGVTNYLAYKVFPNEVPNNYEFETYFAEQLALCVGEKALEEAYFNSDVSNIRKTVNSLLQDYYHSETIDEMDLDIFDILAGQMDQYSCSFLYAEDANMLYAAMSMIDSLEEEILFLGKNSGKNPEQLEVLSKYRQQTGLDQYTHLKTIAKKFKTK